VTVETVDKNVKFRLKKSRDKPKKMTLTGVTPQNQSQSLSNANLGEPQKNGCIEKNMMAQHHQKSEFRHCFLTKKQDVKRQDAKSQQ